MANLPQPTRIDSAEVQLAWEAFEVLQKAEWSRPSLAHNPYFEALRDTAYSRFLLMFEVME